MVTIIIQYLLGATTVPDTLSLHQPYKMGIALQMRKLSLKGLNNLPNVNNLLHIQLMCRKYSFHTQFFLILNLKYFSTAFQEINWILFNLYHLSFLVSTNIFKNQF